MTEKDPGHLPHLSDGALENLKQRALRESAREQARQPGKGLKSGNDINRELADDVDKILQDRKR